MHTPLPPLAPSPPRIYFVCTQPGGSSRRIHHSPRNSRVRHITRQGAHHVARQLERGEGWCEEAGWGGEISLGSTSGKRGTGQGWGRRGAQGLAMLHDNWKEVRGRGAGDGWRDEGGLHGWPCSTTAPLLLPLLVSAAGGAARASSPPPSPPPIYIGPSVAPCLPQTILVRRWCCASFVTPRRRLCLPPVSWLRLRGDCNGGKTTWRSWCTGAVTAILGGEGVGAVTAILGERGVG